ncbi:MAG: histidine--tRNA ligase [Alphaproteobacteria bacterium]|nr:histidine--tRNA ligase [Alphaproteobacteria bacterium]
MQSLQPVRGTQDLLPEAARRHRRVAETARELAERYGFAEIATPIFEFTEVFTRPIGETTDIVAKEMYTFTDRGGEEITLRPENTAGVVRAVLSNALVQSVPLKFFYQGPMFRYERPQKGRFRQFHQIGVELIGVAQPQADIEVITLGLRILNELGIGKRVMRELDALGNPADPCIRGGVPKVALELNTLGDPQSRAAYRDALVGYFSSRASELSEDSRRRLGANPLRILDSKDPGDQRIVRGAPEFSDYLNKDSHLFFAQVRDGLDRLGIEYRLNPRLVRGLDYYTHTVFEFVTTDLGAQGTILAGGRYDGLVETMGGPAMPGVGWAAGVERLAMLISEPDSPQPPVAVVPIGATAEGRALVLAERLRDAGLAVDLAYSGNLTRRLRRANRIGAFAAILLGDDELAHGAATLRDLGNGQQSEVLLTELPTRLKALAGTRIEF